MSMAKDGTMKGSFGEQISDNQALVDALVSALKGK